MTDVPIIWNVYGVAIIILILLVVVFIALMFVGAVMYLGSMDRSLEKRRK